MDPPRTPRRSEAQTKERVTTSSKPRQTVQSVIPSLNNHRSSEYTTITLKKYNQLKGALSEYIRYLPESEQKRELIDINTYIKNNSPENITGTSFDESMMIPRSIIKPPISKINTILEKIQINHLTEKQKETKDILEKVLKPLQTGGKKKSKNNNVVKELKRPLLKNEQRKKSNS